MSNCLNDWRFKSYLSLIACGASYWNHAFKGFASEYLQSIKSDEVHTEIIERLREMLMSNIQS